MTFEDWIAGYRIDGRKITWTRTYSDMELRKIARDAWDAQLAVSAEELSRLRLRVVELEAELESADDARSEDVPG